jgi:hypothetical protein
MDTSTKSGLDITKGMASLPEGLTIRMMIAEYFNAIRKHIELLIEKHINDTTDDCAVMISP